MSVPESDSQAWGTALAESHLEAIQWWIRAGVATEAARWARVVGQWQGLIKEGRA